MVISYFGWWPTWDARFYVVLNVLSCFRNVLRLFNVNFMSTADNRLRVWDETIRLQVAYRFVSFERWCWGTLFDSCNDFIWTHVAICKAEWSPAIIATNDVKCHYLEISIENIRKLRKKIILIAPHLDWTILSRVTYSINESEITDLWK